MSQENPFGEAMDEAESDGEGRADDEQNAVAPPSEFDVDAFLDGLSEGPKNKTIGIAVTDDMHAVWRQMSEDDDVEVDVTESIRNHLENLANRHRDASERAGLKQAIDRGEL
jgi:hypothetical protein